MNPSIPTHTLITGATSGIGYELARLFARDGKNLILVARLEERLAEVQAELVGEFGVDVRVLDVDLFDPAAPAEVYRRVCEAGLIVGVLVNNAGQGEHGEFATTDLARQLAIVQLNVNAVVALTHYFLQDMLAHKSGKILQLGSSFSKVPGPLLSVYAATKAFVLSFSEALINELRDTGVTMTVLMPGATDTDFFHKAGAERSKVYAESKLANPADVALDGYEALMSGQSSIVSGFKNKLNSVVADLSPHTLNAAMARAKTEPSVKPIAETRTEATHPASRRERAALASRLEL
jgi:uncharacterized protein